MIIEIRPKTEGKWHGKEGSEIFSRPIKWPAAIHPRTRRYDVDLTEEDIEVLSKTNYDISVEPQLDEQGKAILHPTWESKVGIVSLPRMNTLVLDTSNVIDRIKYAVIKRCPLVAPSKSAMDSGEYPEAEFYIHSDELEIASKQEKVSLRRNATKLSFEMTADDKKNIIWILKEVDVTGKKEGYVDVLIEELVAEKPAEFVQYGTMDKAEFNTLALVHEAVYKGVLIKDGGSILWGSDQIGTDIFDAVEYLNKDKNQPIKVRIMDRLNK